MRLQFCRQFVGILTENPDLPNKLLTSDEAHFHLHGTVSTLRIGSFKLFKHLLPGVFNNFNPLNAELNPICYLLALLAHHFLHISRIRVKSLTLRLLMSYIYIYIYGAHILDVSRSHTMTQHSR